MVHGGGRESDMANDVDTARILVSMVVNVMATLCIAVKVWYDGLEVCLYHIYIMQAIP